MPPDSDPFVHHAELRGKIVEPLQSYFRGFTTEKLEETLRGRGMPTGWWWADEVREASRLTALAGRRDTDLWVFAYGSLMWDPAFRFAEVRRAHAPAHRRRFILKDIYGARGTADAPGLMAALDHGAGCEGLAFRIAHHHVEEETEILWRRECVAPAYTPTFIDVTLANGTVSALTFLADHEAELIDASMTRAEQIRYLATGNGFLGTSLQYLSNIAGQFTQLGIEDADVTALLRDALAFDAVR